MVEIVPFSFYNAFVNSTAELALEIHRRLREAYGSPEWRNPLPALDELVSTILSQNTNDTNRDRAFSALKERFPKWDLVRDAEPDLIIDTIRSAGLANQKGPRIQEALRTISEQQGSLDLDFLSEMPAEEAKKWLLKLNGVGLKTAAIVMQFSLGFPAFPVDTHIHRLSGRLNLRDAKATADATHEILANLFPEETYYDAHLNLIRHGREVCHARTPACEQCMLSDICHYYQTVALRAEL